MNSYFIDAIFREYRDVFGQCKIIGFN